MRDEITQYFQNLGKLSAAKRWSNHVKMTPEELKEYRKMKQREYRAKNKPSKLSQGTD